MIGRLSQYDTLYIIGYEMKSVHGCCFWYKIHKWCIYENAVKRLNANKEDLIYTDDVGCTFYGTNWCVPCVEDAVELNKY